MDQPQKTNAGFIVGGIFSLLLIIIHVIVDAVNYWSSGYSAKVLVEKREFGYTGKKPLKREAL